MLTAIGRASVQRVLVRSSALAARRTATATPTFARAVVPASRNFTTSRWSRFPDAAEKPAAKTKKAPAKKTAAKPKAAAKKKVAVKKVVKKKKAAVKPKPKPKKIKKVLAPEEKLKKDIKELKAKALYKKEPKRLPATKWTVFAGANLTPGTTAAAQMPALAVTFRSLSASELQSLSETAAENKIANEAAYKAWVESYSPIEIYEANVARRALRRKSATAKSPVTRSYTIRDERLPKSPQHAFTLFTKSRWASGDLSGKAIHQSKQVSEEFKALDPAERKAYDDLAAADMVRYTKEVKEVLGKEVKTPPSP